MSECPVRLIPLVEVMDRVGLGKTAIYERIARGMFPKQVLLGSTARWVEGEIDAWIKSKIAERDGRSSE